MRYGCRRGGQPYPRKPEGLRVDSQVVAPIYMDKDAYWLEILFEYWDGEIFVFSDWVKSGPTYVRGT